MIATADADRFRLLYELGCAFAARTDLAELIPFVIAKCREALNAEAASVLLLDRERNELYFPYVSDQQASVAEVLMGLRLPADQGIAGAALSSGEALIVADAQTDPRFYAGIDRQTGAVTHSVLAVPLKTAEGTIGVLEVINRCGGGSFGLDELAFLQGVSGSITIAIDNARTCGELRISEASLRTQVGVLRRDLARDGLFTEIVASGPAMAEVFALMESAAASSIAVLIEGETGTGKELVARGIHRAGARSEGPFVAVNCAALPETLLESELFGHRRGAFTGAVRDSPGVFRAAAGGVVFLDEVAEMPLSMQAKLLRVLEQEEVLPVGESFPTKVDVRILSASNRDLKGEVARGGFREDLYYRLAAFPIPLPPLRERREDIPLLTSRFISVAATRQHKQVSAIEPAALDLLCKFGWPGNIRQLRNEIDRAVALARDGATIGPALLSAAVRGATAATTPLTAPVLVASRPASSVSESRRPLREARAAFEAAYIAEALGAHHGNVSRTAEALGISRPALQEKMKSYHLR
ncbi:MAG: sigma 54-interacting transcriptional regulator [Candidatus Binataceae bacterium]|nr:sigma 54-interacting transcriptional regulator [Candidatus Binataceae bacterium]